MSKRVQFTDGEKTLIMPVEPQSYTINWEQSIESVTLHSVGTATLAGKPKAASDKLSLLLPAAGNKYSFASGSKAPQTYINKLKKWMRNRTVLQYTIENTNISRTVYIRSMSASERDPSGDVFLELTLTEYIMPAQETITGKPKTSPKKEKKKKCGGSDTWKTLAKEYYGGQTVETNLGTKDLSRMLAKYNGKSYLTVLKGKTVKIPTWAKLKGVKG